MDEKEDIRQWFAVFKDPDGSLRRLPISDKDAWNYDIEIGLLVRIRLTGRDVCSIFWKAGARKYHTI